MRKYDCINNVLETYIFILVIGLLGTLAYAIVQTQKDEKANKKIELEEKLNDSINNLTIDTMNVCVVNGKRYKLPDGSVSIINDEIYVNGKKYVDGKDFKEKTLNITIEGNVNNIETPSGKVTVNGDAGNVSTTSGDITIKGQVSGGVSTTSGDVEIGGNVGGNIHTVSGDVKCSQVIGEASSVSGDVRQRANVKDILKKHFEPYMPKKSEIC